MTSWRQAEWQCCHTLTLLLAVSSHLSEATLSSQSHSGAGGTRWWGARGPITPGQQVGTSGASGVSRDVSISMETAKL